MKVKDKYLDIMWEMYTHLENCENEELADAIYFLVVEHEFDIDELPPQLFRMIKKKLKADYEERNL